jgi:uncharacterized membrane protein YfcA
VPGRAGSGGPVMTTAQLTLLIVAAFAGGMAFGVSGFAYGVIASLFLHHGFEPTEVVFLLVAGGLLLNFLFLHRFWADINFRGSLPFIAGATLGLPLGVASLRLLQPDWVRGITSCLILAYCSFALLRHKAPPLKLDKSSARIADVGIGIAGGIVGGVAGLGPLLPSVWYGLRGFDKRQARGLTQPFGLYVQGAMVAWFLVAGNGAHAAVHALGVALLPMIAGAWLGTRVFDRMSTISFQRIIIWMALVGSIALLGRQLLER